MTLTLELTPEQERLLQDKAAKTGLDVQNYILRMIEGPDTTETTGQRLKRLGILGGVSGKPRPDGRPWSEIEGFE